MNNGKIGFGIIARATLVSAGLLLTSGYGHATDNSKERQAGRDVKQDTRQGARTEKVDCRQANNKSNSECRQDKRDTKQDGRDQARDIKR